MQDREVACTAHNVTPASPEALSLSLLLGDRELGEALSREVEEEPQQGEDLLFRVTGRWLVPSLDTPTPPALHCRATMTLPGVQLSHQRAIPGESLRFRAACSQCPSAPPSLDRRCPGAPWTAGSTPRPGPSVDGPQSSHLQGDTPHRFTERDPGTGSLRPRPSLPTGLQGSHLPPPMSTEP